MEKSKSFSDVRILNGSDESALVALLKMLRVSGIVMGDKDEMEDFHHEEL